MTEKMLSQVKIINAKYDLLLMKSSENFNLFDIMNMRTDEVKTHSSIIRELLDPNGSHNFNDTFLNLFIDEINNEFSLPFSNLNTSYLRVKSEHYIGEISESQDKGGRIDILISTNNVEICIENKIKAKDEPYQLRRYQNYLQSTNKKTLLLYLTLNGKEASSKSTCTSKLENDIWIIDSSNHLESKKDYFCISYKKTILSWLENCFQLVQEIPILRESLKQYIILIKSLTKQSKSTKMNNEIKNIILKDINSAELIHSSFFDSLNQIIVTFCKELKGAFIDYGIEENLIEVRNWKEESVFFSVFVKKEENKPRIGFEIYNGSRAFSDTSSMIDIEDEKWGKNPEFTWNKKDTFNFLSEFHNGSVDKKKEIIDNIKNLILEIK